MTLLNVHNHATNIDRMLHRYEVNMMHISYVLLNKKCELFHQSLQLDKSRGSWRHAASQSELKYSRSCARRRHEMSPSGPSSQARPTVHGDSGAMHYWRWIRSSWAILGEQCCGGVANAHRMPASTFYKHLRLHLQGLFTENGWQMNRTETFNAVGMKDGKSLVSA